MSGAEDAALLSAQERTLRAQLAAYSQHAAYDPRETTAAGRAAFLSRFEDQVDPTRSLPENERLRRAEAARKAYFTRLSFEALRARGLSPVSAGVPHA
jgi:hypothetical protein